MLIRALHPWGSDSELKPAQIASFGKFTNRDPSEGTVARVKARHPTGEYVPPFLCRWSNGRWLNDRSGTPIEAEVIGWREAR